MTRTANVFARIEPEIKEQAEQVLEKLGIPMSNAIGIFLHQVVLQQGIPFAVRLPTPNVASLTEEQFGGEISKGLEDIKNGSVQPADAVEAGMHRDYGSI